MPRLPLWSCQGSRLRIWKKEWHKKISVKEVKKYFGGNSILPDWGGV
jgi:hypothetical protein